MNENKKASEEEQDGLTQLLQVINSSTNEEKIKQVTSHDQDQITEEKGPQ